MAATKLKTCELIIRLSIFFKCALDAKGKIMKKHILFILILFSFSCISECNGAAVYSFEGVISSLHYDGAGIIADAGFQVGDPVSARFYVDFQRKANVLLNNGEIEVWEDTTELGNNPHWYFYATLLDGTLLPVKNGGAYNLPTDIALHHVGWLSGSPVGNSGVLFGGSGNSNLVISKNSYTDVRVQNWVIGEHLSGTMYSVSSDLSASIMWADMELVDIQPVPVVTGKTPTRNTMPTWN